MKSRILRNSIAVPSVSLIALATVSIGAHTAAAANTRHTRHTYASHTYPSRTYASPRQGPWFARGGTLPYGPEYGFLRRLPPNAIAGPGYTFVPGVGILGESCDLPTSACTNEYRDVK